MVKRLLRQIFRIAIFIGLIFLIMYRFDIYEKITLLKPFPYLYKNFTLGVKFLFLIYLGGIGLSIFMKNDSPASTIAWILVLFASPIWGFIAYLVFGRSFNMGKKRTIKKALKKVGIMPDELVLPKHFTGEKLAQMIYNSSGAALNIYNDSKLYMEGENQFRDVIKDIKMAQSSIDVEYYIIQSDSTGKEFTDALCEKSLEGLEINLIYDDVGSYNLDEAILRKLKKSGVNVVSFLPLRLPRFTKSLNYRNHRKIIIIDEEIAYIGGMNIGDEYRSLSSDYDFWRDTHIRIKGEAVHAIQRCFVQDWLFANSKSDKSKSDYIRKKLLNKSVNTEKLQFQPMQIVSSGPDTKWQSIRQAYFLMICSAQKTIKITTPYLVPDSTIMSALKTASLSGVAVDIIVPKKADHFFAYWATRSSFEALVEAGVNIYEYKKGFMHSKGIVIDGKISSIGTANFDIRSLKLNFEINAFIYDKALSLEIQDSFNEDIKNSDLIDRKEYKNRTFRRKFLEALGRVVSPLQ